MFTTLVTIAKLSCEMLCDNIVWSLALPNISTTTTSAALLCVCTARVVKVIAVFTGHVAF